jgi:hypothetical protein
LPEQIGVHVPPLDDDVLELVSPPPVEDAALEKRLSVGMIPDEPPGGVHRRRITASPLRSQNSSLTSYRSPAVSEIDRELFVEGRSVQSLIKRFPFIQSLTPSSEVVWNW